MNRLLTFHSHDTFGNTGFMAPSTYYIDGEYQKVAVRIYAQEAPTSDAKFDIFADGVSIFTDEILLPAGQNSEEAADDFTTTQVEEGTWLTCKMVDAGGGKSFTVQLELHQVSEDETGDD